MSREEINNLLQPFIKKGIGWNEPAGLCFSTSFSMQVYLNIHGISSSLKAGRYKNQDHFWLAIENDMVIDATLKQFDDEQPEVYIGSVAFNPITNGFESYNLDLAGWYNIYDMWRDIIQKRLSGISRSGEFERKAILHILSLSASVFVAPRKSNLTMSYPSSSILSLYLDPILSGLRNTWSKNQDIVAEVERANPDFQLLLNAAFE